MSIIENCMKQRFMLCTFEILNDFKDFCGIEIVTECVHISDEHPATEGHHQKCGRPMKVDTCGKPDLLTFLALING
jgi:hypothetical protein